MKKLELGETLGILANVGVLFGILLLVYELAQNRQMIRAQTRSQMATEIVDLLEDISTNPQFASVFRRGISGEELTPDEETQFRYRQLAVFRYFENVHYQYRQGLYDEAEFSAQREAWKGTMSSERVAKAWCSYRMTVSPEFRAELDFLLTTYAC